MWTKADALPVLEVDQELLEHLTRSGNTPQKLALRARILLGAAEGKANYQLSEELNVSRPTILLWRQRYLDAGLAGVLKDAPRPGRKATLTPEKVDAIVHATLHATPKDATHWSVRSMAKAQGVSSTMVHRIWRAHRLQPHRSEHFKLSRDPNFARKVRDVVGLYLNPPDKALVLCVDEKSQIQALDRTQPVLPLRPGIPARQTHDYERHGTTTLFAALNILDGTVIGSCLPRHRHGEFLKFLERIDDSTPRRREVHLILDNYGTHTHAKVQQWFAEHPRYHLHFTPTSASWLNLVERWFADITRKRIRRGTFTSVPALITAIRDYLRIYNRNPKPFIWTAKPSAIMRKIRHCKEALETGH
ncbi:MAG: IS630 family transposase, partial [Candidatus Eisenbacteria bacterium]